MPPYPDPNAQRRNADGEAHKLTGSGVEPPELPAYFIERETRETNDNGRQVVVTEPVEMWYLDVTLEMWANLWASPLAAEFRPETLPGLIRWAILQDRFMRGDDTVKTEIRALEKEYGLTWAEQRKARLAFPEGDDKGGKSDSAGKFQRAKSDRRARLKAVESKPEDN